MNNDSVFKNEFSDSYGDNSMDIKSTLYQLLSYWPWFILSVLLSLSVAFLFNRYSVPRYLVKGTLILQEDENAGNAILDELGANFVDNSNIQNEIGILSSYALLSKVVDSLRITPLFFRIGNLRESQLYDRMPFTVKVNHSKTELKGQRFRITEVSDSEFNIETNNDSDLVIKCKFGDIIELDDVAFSLHRVEESTINQDPIDLVFESPIDLAKSFRNSVRIKPLNRESTILEISSETSTPSLMVDFIDVLMSKYIELELLEKNETSTRTVEFIDNQLIGIQNELFSAESQLETFRSQNKIINISEEGISTFSQLQSLENELAVSGIQKKYYEYLRDNLKNAPKNQAVSPSVVGVNDQALANLIIKYNELSSELIALESVASEFDPRVNTLKIQIQRVLNSIQENVDLLIEGVDLKIKDLDARIDVTERELNLLPGNERKLVNIQRRFSLNENLYIYLLQKKAESNIVKAGNVPTSKVVDDAMVFNRTSPKKLRNYIIAIFLGLAIPLGVILVIGYFDNSIKTLEEINKNTGIPVLGMLALSEYDSGMVIKDHPRSIEAESFRTVRSNLRFMSPENSTGKVVMLTSFLPGEGKTFTALNLASALALAEYRTLLIRLDLRKKENDQHFKVHNDNGIVNLLIEENTIEEITQLTGIQNLYLINSGPIAPNPNELLLRYDLQSFFENVKNEYDYIILDTPPVGMVSDSIELGKFSDVNLFIMRQKQTPKEAIDFINDLNEQGILKNIGVIFNGVDLKKFNYRYGYKNGYKYSKYFR